MWKKLLQRLTKCLNREEKKPESLQKKQKRKIGITVLARPISTGTFVSAIQMLGAMSRKIQRLLEENAKLQRKLEDERYVSRAKALLIEKQGMTEGEAHKYLERQAMNGSVTRREVALKIIRESGRIIVS